MTARKLTVPHGLWISTWEGLRVRGAGLREAACVWAGTRAAHEETARDVIFLDDLAGTVGRRDQHRTSREAVNALLSRTRELGMVIVGDIHTHPTDWVDLSLVDQEHPIEYRVGLLALVLPEFAVGAPDITRTGIHEYAGAGRWNRIVGANVGRRLRFLNEGDEV
jgi:hypothetical protein